MALSCGADDRGSLPQLGLATLFSMVYFFLQMHASPFRKRSDDSVAVAASFSLMSMFFCCIFLKFSTLTELEQVNFTYYSSTYLLNTD